MPRTDELDRVTTVDWLVPAFDQMLKQVRITDRPMVPVVGDMRSGKTTTIAYSIGLPMEGCYDDNTGQFIIRVRPDAIVPGQDIPQIGHGSDEVTLLPGIYSYMGGDKTLLYDYCDLPGFFGNKGPVVHILTTVAMEFAIRSAAGRIPAIIVVIAYDGLTARGGKLFRELTTLLANFFVHLGEATNSMVFAITKVPEDLLHRADRSTKVVRTLEHQLVGIRRDLDRRKESMQQRGMWGHVWATVKNAFTGAETREIEEFRAKEREEELLKLILEHQDRVVIIDPLDDGSSRTELERCLAKCSPIDLSCFNFETCGDARRRFIELASVKVSEALECVEYERSIPGYISRRQEEIRELDERIRSYSAHITTLRREIRGEIPPVELEALNAEMIRRHHTLRVAHEASKQHLREQIAVIDARCQALETAIRELEERPIRRKPGSDEPEPYWVRSVKEKNRFFWTKHRFVCEGIPLISSVRKVCTGGYDGEWFGTNYEEGWGEEKRRTDDLEGRQSTYEVTYLSEWRVEGNASVEIYVAEKDRPENVTLIVESKKEIGERNTEKDRLLQRIAELDTEIADSDRRLRAVNEDNKRILEDEVARLERSVHRFEGDIKTLRREIANADQKGREAREIISQNLASSPAVYPAIGRVILGIGANRGSALFNEFLTTFHILPMSPAVQVESVSVSNPNEGEQPQPVSPSASSVEAPHVARVEVIPLLFEVPHEFIDSVSYEVMRDPIVVGPCGHSFDRTTVDGLLATSKKECPIDRTKIAERIPNITLRQAIESWRESCWKLPDSSHDNLSTLERRERELALELECTKANIVRLRTSQNSSLPIEEQGAAAAGPAVSMDVEEGARVEAGNGNAIIPPLQPESAGASEVSAAAEPAGLPAQDPPVPADSAVRFLGGVGGRPPSESAAAADLHRHEAEAHDEPEALSGRATPV